MTSYPTGMKKPETGIFGAILTARTPEEAIQYFSGYKGRIIDLAGPTGDVIARENVRSILVRLGVPETSFWYDVV